MPNEKNKTNINWRLWSRLLFILQFYVPCWCECWYNFDLIPGLSNILGPLRIMWTTRTTCLHIRFCPFVSEARSHTHRNIAHTKAPDNASTSIESLMGTQSGAGGGHTVTPFCHCLYRVQLGCPHYIWLQNKQRKEQKNVTYKREMRNADVYKLYCLPVMCGCIHKWIHNWKKACSWLDIVSPAHFCELWSNVLPPFPYTLLLFGLCWLGYTELYIDLTYINIGHFNANKPQAVIRVDAKARSFHALRAHESVCEFPIQPSTGPWYICLIMTNYECVQSYCIIYELLFFNSVNNSVLLMFVLGMFSICSFDESLSATELDKVYFML